jgi:hypothetical protein
MGHLQMPRNVRILVKRPFDHDRIAVMFYLESSKQTPTLFIRSLMGSQSWVSTHGAHALCIHRESTSILQLSRWSYSQNRSKPWANLQFTTWEEMVLFYCTFVCLKARSMKTIQVNPNEFVLRKEKRLFQAQIIDDDFQHSLMVYRDKPTGGYRLHAAVWDGVLRQCPVWTAFLKPSKSPDSWIIQKSSHRIWLRDIEPYTFCDNYMPQNQRKSKTGAFELNFVNSEAATRFKETFLPTPEPTTVATEDSDDGAEPGGA